MLSRKRAAKVGINTLEHKELFKILPQYLKELGKDVRISPKTR